MNEPDPFQAIRDAATSARRSKLHLWMARNHDRFADALAEAGKPNWAALASHLGSMGLTDSKGRPPTAERTRQTWFQVRTARAKKRVAARPPASDFAGAASLRPSSGATSAPVAATADDELFASFHTLAGPGAKEKP